MAKRISPDELSEMQKTDQPVVIDVRTGDKFTAGHVPGARHIPLADIENGAYDLPKDRPIVTY